MDRLLIYNTSTKKCFCSYKLFNKSIQPFRMFSKKSVQSEFENFNKVTKSSCVLLANLSFFFYINILLNPGNAKFSRTDPSLMKSVWMPSRTNWKRPGSSLKKPTKNMMRSIRFATLSVCARVLPTNWSLNSSEIATNVVLSSYNSLTKSRFESVESWRISWNVPSYFQIPKCLLV